MKLQKYLKIIVIIVLGSLILGVLFTALIMGSILAIQEYVTFASIAGILLAGAVALAITLNLIIRSNDIGSEQGQIEDFTRKQIKVKKVGEYRRSK